MLSVSPGLPSFSPSDVDEKWHIKSVLQRNDLPNNPDDPDYVAPPPPIVPSCPIKVGGRALSSREKYNKFLKLCARAGSLASMTGGNQFLQRCKAIETMITLWENGQEVSVTATASPGQKKGNITLVAFSLSLFLMTEFSAGREAEIQGPRQSVIVCSKPGKTV